ncbi:helix-turn-helix transcriptional regulator [uncultured Bradyrhizobium sp.]|uniref:helix-turn-helix domain-containing protein n=1 Tax=uncultured Bradyrhizobium sp. TaxID=199684 RepID=UPI0026342901|nr:helix-turn-helix transcriptional regulator [uncultured Bradyrhizobium sp.]
MTESLDSATLRQLRQRGGLLLRERRKNLGLSQRELAERIGLAPYTIVAQLESGVGRIEPAQYVTWADALELPIAQFVARLLEHTDPYAYNLFVASIGSAKGQEVVSLRAGIN